MKHWRRIQLMVTNINGVSVVTPHALSTVLLQSQSSSNSSAMTLNNTNSHSNINSFFSNGKERDNSGNSNGGGVGGPFTRAHSSPSHIVSNSGSWNERINWLVVWLSHISFLTQRTTHTHPPAHYPLIPPRTVCNSLFPCRVTTDPIPLTLIYVSALIVEWWCSGCMPGRDNGKVVTGAS